MSIKVPEEFTRAGRVKLDATLGKITGAVTTKINGEVSKVTSKIANVLNKVESVMGRVASIENEIAGVSTSGVGIGSFAGLVFEVSNFKVLTYDEYKRESKARTAKHELINQTPVIEFLGRDVETISFTMTFTKQLNSQPEQTTQTLREFCQQGLIDNLVFGTTVVGDCKWFIDSISEEVQMWNNQGEVLVSKVDVKLIEYVEAVNYDS